MKPPIATRLSDAWLVLRGIVDVAALRQYALEEATRAGNEMRAHQATIDRCNVEMANRGNELSKLRGELREMTSLLQRQNESADRHAREHINRADALNKVIQQFESDCQLELRMRYERHAPPGVRFKPVTTYKPGTILERRDAANRPIARSLDGGETWHAVHETLIVGEDEGVSRGT